MTANSINSQPAAQSAPGHRRCLSCGLPFASGGRHEWICPRCKESETWLAGISEHALHAENGRPKAGEGE